MIEKVNNLVGKFKNIILLCLIVLVLMPFVVPISIINSNTISTSGDFRTDAGSIVLNATSCDSLYSTSDGLVVCGINQTQAALDYIVIQGYLDSGTMNNSYLINGENISYFFIPNDVVFSNESTLNASYLIVGQNLSIDDWTNVLFSNESTLNDSYLKVGENLTSGATSAELNASYLLIGENSTSGLLLTGENLTINDWTNVAFTNDSIFNATYDTYAYNQTTPAIDYFINNPFTYNSTYDTWSYNMTTPAIDYCIGQSYIPSSALNASYLLVGENLTSFDNTDVVYLNNTELNTTYVRLYDINNSYLLVGENLTSFDNTDIAYFNNSDLNSTYVRLDNINDTYLQNDTNAQLNTLNVSITTYAQNISFGDSGAMIYWNGSNIIIFGG